MAVKETRKTELLDVASRLFYEQGYHATGIKQIIDAAGIAKGTFYSHFSSKEELGLAWLKAKHESWTRWRNESIATPDRGPREQVLALFTSLRQAMIDCNYRGCMFLNTLAETPDITCPMRKEIRNHKRGLLEFLRDRVNRHLPHESDERSAQIAGSLFLLFEASLIESQNFREIWPVDVAVRQAEELLPL